MHTSVRSDFLHCSGTTSLTSRTAVYGPVRTVVWQGSAGNCRPYADQVGLGEAIRAYSWLTGNPGIETLSLDCDLNHERSKEAYS